MPPASTSTDSTTDIDDDDTVEVEAGDPPLPGATPEDCAGRLFVPHKRDCSKYFLCNFGSLSEHSCPPGLYWNEDRCDWPENTKCKDSQRDKLLPLIAAKQRDQKKVVCYLMKWARKRPSAGRFTPEDIDVEACTHIVYGLAKLDPERLTIQNPQRSRQKELLDRIADIRSRTGLKVLLGLGGWEESKDDKYSTIAHSSLERQRFARHASQYIQSHGFDGLDIIWEYPVCWQVTTLRATIDAYLVDPEGPI